MEQKPVSPKVHGIMDYAVSGMQLLVPQLLNINPAAKLTYGLLSAGVLANNALSDTPVGVKRNISMKQHKNVDTGLLLGQLALLALPFIRKDKKALALGAGLLALTLVQFLLTDYKSGSVR